MGLAAYLDTVVRVAVSTMLQVCFELQQPCHLFCSTVLEEYLTSSSCHLLKAAKVNMAFSFLTFKLSSSCSPNSAFGHSSSGSNKNAGPLNNLSLLRSWCTESPRDSSSAGLRDPVRCLHWLGIETSLISGTRFAMYVSNLRYHCTAKWSWNLSKRMSRKCSNQSSLGSLHEHVL